jgi:hypothetical protein
MVKGMRRPMPSSWLISVLCDGGVDRAGREEQGDLAEGVGGDVQGRGHQRQRGQQRGGDDDVGELRDGRVGEAALEVVLEQGDEAGDQDRRAGM